MEEVKYTIYKLIDPESNKIRYIGLTFNTLKQRLKSHYNENSKSHKCFWIKKLKSKGLKPIIEPIEENIGSYEKACEKEIYYIEYYRSNGHKLTNQASGGNKNKKMSDETRNKMSISAKNREFKLILSDQSKRKISESTKIRMQDPKEIQKLKIANKLYEDSKTDEQKLADILIQDCKVVYKYDKQMNLIDKYPSINNAGKKSGSHPNNIRNCCYKKIVAVGGYIWRFEGDLTPPSYKIRGRRANPVLQYNMSMDLLNEFNSIKEASKITGVYEIGISTCCEHKFKSSGGFIWRYK